ncbi:exostosin family protein [Striga asiatica]|uniref:Exostosin family protein n=1 Tax=Striga asiatica TaxID=4170 RepID=A0A5A7RKJ6_STRAF|nr:exostosin family protein [Striga asiatica]
MTTLGYCEGVANSETRKMLVRLWSGDQDLEIIKTKVLVRERGHRLRHDKFCLCVAWSPNPNACITMIILNECVPDCRLKQILEEKASAYTMQQVQTHFFIDWGKFTEYDGFQMIVYQLLRPSGGNSSRHCE